MGGATGGVSAQQELANSSDTTRSELPPHQNPEQIETENNLDQLETLLRGSLDRQLTESLANLDEADYEQAQQLLDEEYNGDLSRYRELAGDLDKTEQAELFRTVRSDQQEYITAVEAYEATRQEYEQARENGDDERARELARNLSSTANELNGDGDGLSGSYQGIQRETSQNYTDRITEIDQRRTEAIETSQQATESEFTRTTLSATANRSAVSFTDSLLISGAVQTADGTPLEKHQAQLTIQNQSYPVDVGSNGEFELTAAPDGVWETESDGLHVRYRPARSSAYLGSRSNLSVSVDATATTVALEPVRTRVSYDDPVRINGSVTAAETGKPVPTGPMELRLGGSRIGTTQTTDGQFSFQAPIPATVSADETVASVRLSPSSLSLEQSRAETELTIEPTQTAVGVNASVAETTDGEPFIRVRGSVDSAGGRPVPAAPVTIRIDETEVGVVETDSDGRFTERFTAPDDAEPGETVIISAGFAPQESTLQAATGSTTVTLPETLLESVGNVSNPTILLVPFVLLGIGLAVGLVGWWLYGRSTVTPQSPTEITEQPQTEPTQDRTLLGAAADSLDEGAHESAAALAYAAVRRQLASEVDVSETATHWEWYQACAAAGVDQLSEIEALVEAFEQVAFAPDSGTGETSTAAAVAVSTARQFVDSDQ